jgi:hypothetical protein
VKRAPALGADLIDLEVLGAADQLRTQALKLVRLLIDHILQLGVAGCKPLPISADPGSVVLVNAAAAHGQPRFHLRADLIDDTGGRKPVPRNPAAAASLR